MKQVKGKYIRITESQLNKIISEEVKKQLQILNEYAIPRSKYIDNASNYVYQIIENWCLVHYCTLTGRTETKEHWKKELRAHISNIGKDDIKGKSSYETKYKALVEAFNYKDAFNGTERILKIIKSKFQEEKINTNSNEFVQTATDCSNNINNIIEVIANFFEIDINDYLNSI